MEREADDDCLIIMADEADCSLVDETDCSQIMEYRPNSKPEEKWTALKTESVPLPLSEHYILTRAVDVWDGPKFVTFRTKEARLKSFVIHEWPLEWHPKPSASIAAGFFYTGKN